MNIIFRFFWAHIKPFKWHYLVMMTAPVLSSFYPFLYNYAIKLFLDTIVSLGTEALSYQSVLWPIIVFIAAHLGMEICWRISNIAEWRSIPYVKRSMILKAYDYVQHYNFAFFQNNFTGSISGKLKGITDGFDKFWVEMHHGLMLNLLKCLVNLGALIMINRKLGLFVVGWTLIYVPVMSKLSSRLNQLSFEETESHHSLAGQIADKISNIVSLFSFAARHHELRALDEQIHNQYLPRLIRTHKFDFKVQMIASIFYFTLFTFIALYMVHLKIHGEVTIGDFAFVFGIALVVGEDIWKATVSLQEFSRAMGDLKSAISIINPAFYNPDPIDAQILRVTDGKIEFRDLSFGYDNAEFVLKNLNLVIKPGEKIGLVGHSGAGKTSLINLLLRYFDSTSGEILIDSQNINDVTQDSLRAAIAVIPQETGLFHRSLFENIHYGRPEATYDQVIEASRKAQLHDFITGLENGYDTEVGERGVKLSGGQRQRVAIARAILKNAPILILDEATSALDSVTEKHIQDALNVLIEDRQKTVIAIAHRLSTLKHMDRILVLDKGVIVEEGTHQELIHLAGSLYKRLWKLQEI